VAIRTSKKVENPPLEEVVEVEEVEEPNIICEYGKYASYTNIDTINILWQYIDIQDYYVSNGVVRESSTGAILVAMGTYYEVDQYYNVTFEDGTTIFVKNIDIKAPEHTDINNCYTTADNSIIEIWVTNDFEYLWAGISKHTKFGSVTRIEEA
jgi:hypothetical protein